MCKKENNDIWEDFDDFKLLNDWQNRILMKINEHTSIHRIVKCIQFKSIGYFSSTVYLFSGPNGKCVFSPYKKAVVSNPTCRNPKQTPPMPVDIPPTAPSFVGIVVKHIHIDDFNLKRLFYRNAEIVFNHQLGQFCSVNQNNML